MPVSEANLASGKKKTLLLPERKFYSQNIPFHSSLTILLERRNSVAATMFPYLDPQAFRTESILFRIVSANDDCS